MNRRQFASFLGLFAFAGAMASASTVHAAAVGDALALPATTLIDGKVIAPDYWKGKVLIVERFATLDAAQLVALLEDAQIANAQVNGMAEVWAHPQLKARGRWTEVATPAGAVPALLPPGMAEARMAPIPALGEHSEAVLAELGYDAAQIAQLRHDGVI